MSATEAVGLVQSGDRVFIHGSAATPVRLVRALLDRHAELHEVELTAISTFGDLGFDRPEVQGPFFLNALFVSASKIVPLLKQGAGVVTTRAHVHYVVTEHGVAYLYGKNLQQRAQALVGIAAPEHREELERAVGERFGRG
jgi:acyl-CoA hydrolase